MIISASSISTTVINETSYSEHSSVERVDGDAFTRGEVAASQAMRVNDLPAFRANGNDRRIHTIINIEGGETKTTTFKPFLALCCLLILIIATIICLANFL